MPWAGRSTLRVTSREPVRATIKLRIPGWARNRPVPSALYRYQETDDRRVTIRQNGAPVEAAAADDGYVSIGGSWREGDTIDLEFPMPARRVVADDRVRAARRRVAIERGPIVYCLEAPDAGGQVLDLMLDRTASLTAEGGGGWLGGASIVRSTAATSVALRSSDRLPSSRPHCGRIAARPR